MAAFVLLAAATRAGIVSPHFLDGLVAEINRVYAHKFRHIFATEYLRRGGEIERLCRILGYTTYVMVMRYVHLDKGDLYRDFETCAPF